MELKTDKANITEEQIRNLYKSNNIELIGPYSIDKILASLHNSFIVITAWDSNTLYGLCRVISDGIYFARIQEIILSPDIEEKEDVVTEILKVVFRECKGLKSFHMNPGVYEKRIIYERKHTISSPQDRKIYWSIHEDEF
jgi:hypothetical protein